MSNRNVKSPKFVLERDYSYGATTGTVYWFWSLRSRNGEIVCQSETYKTKRAAVNAIYRVIDLCGRLSKRAGPIIEEVE